MHLCLGEERLLQYLEGELGAEDDARIVAHVEDCPGCQERLERLTRGLVPLDVATGIDTERIGLSRLVALKMIRGGSQARADHFVRFRVEAESVARLRHPHIIQIYDIGEAGGLPYVALELLDGGSLSDRLAGTPQPGRAAAELT